MAVVFSDLQLAPVDDGWLEKSGEPNDPTRRLMVILWGWASQISMQETKCWYSAPQWWMFSLVLSTFKALKKPVTRVFGLRLCEHPWNPRVEVPGYQIANFGQDRSSSKRKAGPVVPVVSRWLTESLLILHVSWRTIAEISWLNDTRPSKSPQKSVKVLNNWDKIQLFMGYMVKI